MTARNKFNSYRNILLDVLEYLDEYDPHHKIQRKILGTMAHYEDLDGVSDRFEALGILPAEIREKIERSWEEQGRRIIAAKPEPETDVEFEERVTRHRRYMMWRVKKKHERKS